MDQKEEYFKLNKLTHQSWEKPLMSLMFDHAKIFYTLPINIPQYTKNLHSQWLQNAKHHVGFFFFFFISSSFTSNIDVFCESTTIWHEMGDLPQYQLFKVKGCNSLTTQSLVLYKFHVTIKTTYRHKLRSMSRKVIFQMEKRSFTWSSPKLTVI